MDADNVFIYWPIAAGYCIINARAICGRQIRFQLWGLGVNLNDNPVYKPIPISIFDGGVLYFIARLRKTLALSFYTNLFSVILQPDRSAGSIGMS